MFAAGVTAQTFTVQTTPDTLFEPDETFTVSLSNATNGAWISSSAGTATGTILNDDAAPSFAIANSSVSEGGLVTFTVTRTGDAQATESVSYATSLPAADTASANDFTAASGTLTFAAGVTAQTFTVQTTPDTLFEPDETFTVSLSNATNGAWISSSAGTATGTILNDDAAPSFAIANSSVSEGGLVTFTVTRTGGAQATESVSYATSLPAADTASANDFTAASGTLTFAAGVTAQTFTVQTTPDTLFEPDETFTVSLSNATNGAGISSSAGTATGTILNDDAAPSFAIANSSVSEGGLVTFTVTRTGDAQATESVSYATSLPAADTASANDFTAASGTLTFAAGVTAQTFTVQTTPDTLFEPDETFTVSLSNATNGAGISSSAGTATGTILNDDAAPSFAIANSSVSEGGLVTFTVTRTGDAQATESVSYATSLPAADTASANDFTAASGTLTFAAGVTAQTFTVQTTPDTLFEPDETFTVSLSNATNGAGISSSAGTATGTILNDDAAPSFAIANSSVSEGGLVTFTVTRTGDAQATESVSYATSLPAADTASANDFTAASGTLTFAAGVTAQTFTVQTTPDTLFEPDETFTVSLSNATNGAWISSSAGTATGTILNDDAAPSFAIANSSVSEGGLVTFTVTRTGDAQATESVSYATSLPAADTASANDFTAASGTLTFAAGVTAQTFTVQTTPDTLFEPDETFTVSLSNATNGAWISSSAGTATGTILNDDAAPSFAIANSSVSEGGLVTFTVTRTGDAQATESVSYATSLPAADTASANDFTAASGTLTFAAGVTAQTFTVQTTPDTLFEPDETFTVSLSNATNGAWISSSAGTATGTILNDDAAPSFAIANSSVSEGGLVTFTVTRTGDAQATESVSYATSLPAADTASANDFTAASGTLTFAAGVTAQTFTVQTTPDTLFEPDETFTVSLSNATNGAWISSSAGTATGTILNDDAAPSFAIANSSVSEGGLVTFTVTRTGDAQATESVSYATSLPAADTASANDFTAASGTLTFAAGVTAQTFTVQTTPDTLFEPDETFTVSLSNATNGAWISSSAGTATGTILNDDAAPSFAIANSSVSEGGLVTFTVTRTGDAQATESVSYATSLPAADTASANDFTAASGTLTFAAGVTAQTFTVQTTPDTLFEPDETFTVSLSNATNGAGDSSSTGLTTGQTLHHPLRHPDVCRRRDRPDLYGADHAGHAVRARRDLHGFALERDQRRGGFEQHGPHHRPNTSPPAPPP